MKFFMFAAAIAMSLAASATQYSKLAVITAAKSRGCWAGIKAFVADRDLKDEWDSCQYLSDKYPAFATVTNAIVTAGLVTAEDVAFVLSQSKDTALDDDLLTRLYERDVRTASGRQKWHGRKLREIVSTNSTSFVRVSVYEDGARFSDTSRVVRASSNSSVLAANAKLPRPVMTNGIPARLAAARLRQAENGTAVSNVTVRLAAGK